MAKQKPIQIINGERWQSQGGTARNFWNLDTGEVMPRRQFDKTYGALAKQGFKTYEEKAATNLRAEGQEQLAKPARGRSSLRKLQGPVKYDILQTRIEQAKEKELFKAERRLSERKARTPKKIGLSNFKPGKLGRYFRVELEHNAIRDFIKAAGKYSGAFSYNVGVEFFDTRTGKTGAANIIKGRAFNVPFDESDWEDFEAWDEEHLYAQAAFAYVYVALKTSVAESYAKKKRQLSQQRKNGKKS